MERKKALSNTEAECSSRRRNPDIATRALAIYSQPDHRDLCSWLHCIWKWNKIIIKNQGGGNLVPGVECISPGTFYHCPCIEGNFGGACVRISLPKPSTAKLFSLAPLLLAFLQNIRKLQLQKSTAVRITNTTKIHFKCIIRKLQCRTVAACFKLLSCTKSNVNKGYDYPLCQARCQLRSVGEGSDRWCAALPQLIKTTTMHGGSKRRKIPLGGTLPPSKAFFPIFLSTKHSASFNQFGRGGADITWLTPLNWY